MTTATDAIRTHEDIYDVPLQAFVMFHYRNYGNGIVGSEIKGDVSARIDDGRWMADCPSPVCNSALVVSKVDRRFICCECGSSDNAGRWRAVIFPDDMAEIEAAILRRPAWLGRGQINAVGFKTGGPRFWTPVDIAVEVEGRDPVILQPAQTLQDLLDENEELAEWLTP